MCTVQQCHCFLPRCHPRNGTLTAIYAFASHTACACSHRTHQAAKEGACARAYRLQACPAYDTPTIPTANHKRLTAVLLFHTQHPTLNSAVYTYSLDIFNDDPPPQSPAQRVLAGEHPAAHDMPRNSAPSDMQTRGREDEDKSEACNEGIPAYSATNPQNHRFDVIRVLACDRVVSRLRLRGSSSLEHSWFPPLGWSFAQVTRYLKLLQDHLI